MRLGPASDFASRSVGSLPVGICTNLLQNLCRSHSKATFHTSEQGTWCGQKATNWQLIAPSFLAHQMASSNRVACQLVLLSLQLARSSEFKLFAFQESFSQPNTSPVHCRCDRIQADSLTIRSLCKHTWFRQNASWTCVRFCV